MEQQVETSEVLEEFNKAKAEGRQPVCPYCHKPLEIGHSTLSMSCGHGTTKRSATNERNQTGTQTRPSATPVSPKTGTSQTMT